MIPSPLKNRMVLIFFGMVYSPDIKSSGGKKRTPPPLGESFTVHSDSVVERPGYLRMIESS
jgi:hypothetical protein